MTDWYKIPSKIQTTGPRRLKMALNDSKSILLVFHDVPRQFFSNMWMWESLMITGQKWRPMSYSVTNRHKIASKIQNTGPRRLKSNVKWPQENTLDTRFPQSFFPKRGCGRDFISVSHFMERHFFPVTKVWRPPNPYFEKNCLGPSWIYSLIYSLRMILSHIWAF